jgi:hypothetical protein
MHKKNKSVRQSVPAIHNSLRPEDVRKMFKVARKHKPEIVPGMAIQFLARLRDAELFAFKWSNWDGAVLSIRGTEGGLERFAVGDPILKSWLDATAPGYPGAALMTVSRDEYRRDLREIMKLAKVPYPGKCPLRTAGLSMFVAAQFAASKQKLLGCTQNSSTTAAYYNGPSHQSWVDVAKGITPEALMGEPLENTHPAAKAVPSTVRELVVVFGKSELSGSFSCDDPNGHLQVPVGHGRAMARVLCNLVSFAGHLSVHDVTAQRARAFLNHVSAIRHAQSGKGLSHPTILKFAAMAGAAFTFGVKHGLCHVNPFGMAFNPEGQR